MARRNSLLVEPLEQRNGLASGDPQQITEFCHGELLWPFPQTLFDAVDLMREIDEVVGDPDEVMMYDEIVAVTS